MRMQPYEANVPIEDGLFVPWMAYSPPERVMAAAPIGLFGAPSGITSGSVGLSALTSAGGVQAGCTHTCRPPGPCPATAYPAVQPPPGNGCAAIACPD